MYGVGFSWLHPCIMYSDAVWSTYIIIIMYYIAPGCGYVALWPCRGSLSLSLSLSFLHVYHSTSIEWVVG